MPRHRLSKVYSTSVYQVLPGQMFPVGTLTLVQIGQWQSIPQVSAKLPAYPEAITALSRVDLRDAVPWGIHPCKGNFNTLDECYGNWTIEVLWQNMKGCSCSLNRERIAIRCRKGKQSQGSLWRSQPVGRAQTWGESCATFIRRKQFCDFGVKGEKEMSYESGGKNVTNFYFLTSVFSFFLSLS